MVATAANEVELQRTRRVPGLDGLRAVSVLFVIGFHSHFALTRGGFLGVTVFFVLSGFLITGLLTVEQDATGDIKLRRFYLRRLMRLYPALLLLVVLSLLAVLTFLQAWSGTYLSSPLALLYVTNITGAFRDHGGLYLHTWSLSVEEQFYLIWPLGLRLAARRGWTRVRLRGTVLLLALLSAAGAFVAYLAGHATYSRLTPLSAAGLLAGSALSLHLGVVSPVRRAQVARASRALAPLAGVSLLFVLVEANPSGPPSVSTTLVYAFANPIAILLTLVLVTHVATSGSSRTLGALELAPFRRIGKVSYGMYLFHILIWATILRFSPSLPPWKIFLLTATVAYLLAEISYRYVERPVLVRRDLSLGASDVKMAA